jgi:hypothetical protein
MREAHFQVENVQSTPRTDHFWTFRTRFAWQAQGIAHLLRAKHGGFVALPKTMAGAGHLKRIWTDAIRVEGAVQQTHEVQESAKL